MTHGTYLAIKEMIQRKIRTDLIGLFTPFRILDVDIKFDEKNIKMITVTVPFSKKHKNLSLKMRGLDQLNHLKENGYKCNLFWTDKDNGQVLLLILEKQIK